MMGHDSARAALIYLNSRELYPPVPALPLPARHQDRDHLRQTAPDTGREWTDDGSPRERRQLKHRADGDSRIVPVHPELAGCCATIARSSALPLTAACSAGCGAASWPP